MQVGDVVRIKYGVGFSALGLINTMFLTEHKFKGTVEIVEVLSNDEWRAKLPDGHIFTITQKDLE